MEQHMVGNTVTSMSQLISCLNEAGYRRNVRLKNGKLFCSESEEDFHPHEMTLEGTFRFEGASDPENMAIVYALQASNGSRAVVVDAFGTYADPELSEFMESVSDRRRKSGMMESFPPAKTLLITQDEPFN